MNEEKVSLVRRILESEAHEEYPNIAGDLLEVATDIPGLANIASDWLEYGRFGLKKDAELAAFYRKIAIEALLPDAIYDHALILEGQGGEDQKRALGYYILSAVLGDPDAIRALSDFFLYGENSPADYFVSGSLRKHENLIRSKNAD